MPGLHEPLVDELTFARAQALLRDRGDDMALRRSNPGDFLLSGLLRCGRCRRAYVGMSAKGNGGIYHYYACSGRQKLGRKGCDGERLPRDKLEAAVVGQLAALYRDGDVIAETPIDADAEQASGRPAIEEQQRAPSPRRSGAAERALDRYYAGLRNRRPRTASSRPGSPASRPSSTRSTTKRARSPPSSPTRRRASTRRRSPLSPTGSATWSPPANPNRPKALLRLLIKDLRVNGRSEILPTYRVVAADGLRNAKFSGRGWDRTSDPSRVKRVLSR